MSALAARRAAVSAASDPDLHVGLERKAPAVHRPAERLTSPKPSSSRSSISESDDIQTSIKASSKRQRINRSSSPMPRYFGKPQAAPARRPAKPATVNRERRVSPSLPVDELDDGDVADSSLDEGGSSKGIDRRRAAEYDAAQGRERWSMPTPSAGNMPGSSQIHTRPEKGQLNPFPTYLPQAGVNIHHVSHGDLQSAGLVDQVHGPGVLISLGITEKIAIAGMFTVTPLQCPLSIFSTTLHPAPDQPLKASHPVFAPASHPLPVISHTPETHGQAQDPSPILKRLALPSSFRLHDSVARTVFLIREHRCGLEGLRAGVVPGFSSIWLDDRGIWGLRGVHPVMGSFPAPVYPYISPYSWDAALDSLCHPPSSSADDEELSIDQKPLVALIKGPKRVGKSAFGRAALNRLLERHNKVAWLECDLGQAEFGSGGVVGIWVLDRPILGPPFTHPKTPRRAHYLGTDNPSTCPDEYVATIRHLITYYRYELQYSLDTSGSDVLPLVINTQGWVKGLGEGLLNAIETMAESTHVFAFETDPVETRGYEYGYGWTTSPPYQMTELPSNFVPPGNNHVARTVQYIIEAAPTSPLQARYTSADLRILSMMTYFHADLGSSNWDFTLPLLGVTPWQIELGTSIQQIIIIGESAEGIVEEDLTLALNGSIVALLESTESPAGPAYVQARPYPALDDSNFLGLALIRAVHTSSSRMILHLLTPLPPSQLNKAKILVKNGAMELPLCGMLDWRSGGVDEEGLAGMDWEHVPFLEVGGVEVVGGERRRFRRNLMRKGM